MKLSKDLIGKKLQSIEYKFNWVPEHQLSNGVYVGLTDDDEVIGHTADEMDWEIVEEPKLLSEIILNNLLKECRAEKDSLNAFDVAILNFLDGQARKGVFK